MKQSKELLKTALTAGLPFGIGMGVFFSFSVGLQTGILLGLLSGLAFGVAIAVFVEIQSQKMRSKDGFFEGETVVYQGGANHFLNAESRGGWLTLTESRLCFRSHGKNVQNQPVNIAVQAITDVKPRLTLGIIPNGLVVTLTNGQAECFVVTNRASWVKYITHQFKASRIYPQQ